MSQEQGYFIRPRLAIDRDFGVHRNEWVRDKRIVGNPLSIYLYLLSHDQSFRITLESARKGLGLGRDAFITARRTLEAAGYLRTVKVTHPAGAVDANGRPIGGRVLRYDIEVLDPEVTTSGRTPVQPDPAAPVDNSSGSGRDETGLEAAEQEKPWSDPLTGYPVAAEPLPDEPLTDNPTAKENQEDQENQSSSSTEMTTDAPVSSFVAAAVPPDDDGDLDGGGAGAAPLVDNGCGVWTAATHSGPETPLDVSRELEGTGEPPGGDALEPLDLQRLLRAGIEVSLRELDARLNLSEILRRLSDAGVDGERVDVPAAAAFALSAAARRVGDPSAYVAAAIVREPARWPWKALPVSGASASGPTRSTCELQGHRYLDEYRMQCVRCQEERPGWREERYAGDGPGADQARAVAS